MGVSAVVNEQSWRLGLWQGRLSVQRCVPAGAALTRTSLSLYTGGPQGPISRSQERLPAPLSHQACHKGLMLGWLAGWVWGCCDDDGGGEWVGGG